MLSRRARSVRASVSLAFVGALLVGTFWGHDDHFPFGPFRMYAYATKTTGRVAVPAIEVVTDEGRLVAIRAGQLGMRRAELEGQFPRFREDPELLRFVAEAYARNNPDEPPLREVRLLFRLRYLEDGHLTRTGTQLLARWQRHGPDSAIRPGDSVPSDA